MRRLLAGTLLCFHAATTFAAQDASPAITNNAPRIEALVSPVTVRLRGLSAVDENIAWASGRDGTVLRTTDAGKTWSVFKVPGAEKLDFRDVEGFSADEAVILSIGPGEDSRVYRTSDGGQTWLLALQNRNPKAFFDCLDFHGREGRMLGDPVDGRFQVYGSSDAGRTWALLPDGPKASKDEAAFAASGTCIVRGGDYTAIATGGSVARIVFSPDRLTGKSGWRGIQVPMEATAASAGVFSIAMRDRGLVAVGGDFQKPEASGVTYGVSVSSFVYKTHQAAPAPAHMKSTTQGSYLVAEVRGSSWDNVDFARFQDFAGRPLGYRSGVACVVQPRACIATGPSGTDVLPEDARVAANWWRVPTSQPEVEGIRPLTSEDIAVAPEWAFFSTEGYDSVDAAGRVFWFSGDGGRLGRMVLPD